jgi:hypothetical protein
MAWSKSAVFREYMKGFMEKPATTFNPTWGTPIADGDYNVALFAGYTDPTTPDPAFPDPDELAALAATAYGNAAGMWVPANQDPAIDANWPLVGRPLTGVTVTDTAGVNSIMFDAADTSQGPGATVTLKNIGGDLVYFAAANPHQAAQGAAFHEFGAGNDVTAGTFTIVWNPLGVMYIGVG